VVILELRGSRAKPDLEARLNEHLAWDQFNIDEVEVTDRAVKEGEFMGLYETSFRIIIPIKEQQNRTLAGRLYAYFRNAIGAKTAGQLREELRVRATANGSLSGYDGLAELKAALPELKTAHPEAIRFQFEEAGDDLLIVKVAPENGHGQAG
jgi:hypothetical protein